MKFLQQLDEAADIPVDQLKDKMKKDPRVKLIFSRDPQLDQIKDTAEFIRTLRFYLFSNAHVRQHLSRRADRRDISKNWWDRFARTKPTDKLHQSDLDWLAQLVKEFFKDVGYVQKRDISKRAFEAFSDWYSKERRGLDAYTQRELDSLGFKPDAPVLLYRGLLFDERSLRTSEMSNAEGLEFLKSVRKGTRTVDLQYDEPTIWTTDKNTALLQALYGSNEAWRNVDDIKDRKVEKYRGLLGFVVSTLASPDDVLVELAQLEPVYNWPGKLSPAYNTFALKPGKLLARVVSKHTSTGEVDPISNKDDDTPDLSQIKENLTLFGRILKLPFPEIEFEGFGRNAHRPEVMAQMKLLLDPEMKEKVSKLMNTVLNYYRKHLEGLDLEQLASQAGDETKTYEALKAIRDLFKTTIRHRAYADPNAPRRQHREAGFPQVKELKTGDEVLGGEFIGQELDDLMRTIISQKRYTQWDTGSPFTGLAKLADPSYKQPDKIHLAAWKVQKEFIDRGVDGFFKAIGEPKPESLADQVKRMMSAAREATRVAWAARFLQDLRAAALSAGE